MGTEKIQVFIQNSIRIEDSGRVIYIDPFRMTEEPHDATFVLITHEHYDHFSPEDIAKVATKDTVLVVPEKMESKAEQVSDLVSCITTVRPGVCCEIDGLEMEMVPSYNVLKPFHPKSAGWVGYILVLGDERIYIAGDTDVTKEAKAVQCDIALVPAGGTYTMDAKQAADLVNQIKPKVAIPVHYGSVVGKVSDGETFAANVKEPVKVEIRIK